MEILTLVLCVVLSVHSLINGAPCAKETIDETPTHQQPELPEGREAD